MPPCWPRARLQRSSTRCSPPTPMSCASLPMSGRVPFASICRSTSRCPTTSSRSRSWSPRGLKERDQVRARREQAVAVRLPAVVARIYPLELGPPVGWPVKYRVSGPDLARVHEIALKVAEQLEAMTGIRHINFDWAEPARVMRVRIDQDQARQLGLSSQDVSLALYGVVSGSTITQVRNSIYLINVDMRAEHKERTSLESIRSLQIPLRDGNVVPLRQIA